MKFKVNFCFIRGKIILFPYAWERAEIFQLQKKGEILLLHST